MPFVPVINISGETGETMVMGKQWENHGVSHGEMVIYIV